MTKEQAKLVAMHCARKIRAKRAMAIDTSEPHQYIALRDFEEQTITIITSGLKVFGLVDEG